MFVPNLKKRPQCIPDIVVMSPSSSSEHLLLLSHCVVKAVWMIGGDHGGQPLGAAMGGGKGSGVDRSSCYLRLEGSILGPPGPCRSVPA